MNLSTQIVKSYNTKFQQKSKKLKIIIIIFLNIDKDWSVLFTISFRLYPLTRHSLLPFKATLHNNLCPICFRAITPPGARYSEQPMANPAHHRALMQS